MKLVQRALNHADIKTTAKYAHVLDDEVAAGMDAVQKSRKKSRKPISKVG
jgi:site-specific recombinase XerD